MRLKNTPTSRGWNDIPCVTFNSRNRMCHNDLKKNRFRVSRSNPSNSFTRVLPRLRSRRCHGAAWLSVFGKGPLVYFPGGLPGIISHYPRHSSNAAGAGKKGRLVSSRCPHIRAPLPLSCFFSLVCPRGCPSKSNSPEDLAGTNQQNLEVRSNVVKERKRN